MYVKFKSNDWLSTIRTHRTQFLYKPIGKDVKELLVFCQSVRIDGEAVRVVSGRAWMQDGKLIFVGCRSMKELVDEVRYKEVNSAAAYEKLKEIDGSYVWVEQVQKDTFEL